MKQKELVLLVYCSGLPLPASYDVDETGAVIVKRLSKGLLPGEKQAILWAKEQGAKVIAVSVGHSNPKDLLQQALAYGANEAVWIGDFDWPENPSPQLIAAALKQEVATKVDGFLFALPECIGVLGALPLVLGQQLQCVAFSQVMAAELQPEICRVIRKLERGKRQQISAPYPIVIDWLSTKQEMPAPSLAKKMAAKKAEVQQRHCSYAALNRCFAEEKWQETGWQTKALQPLTQAVWQPDAALSGEGRLDAMIQGEVQSRHGQKVMGTPQECAEAIVGYLLQQGLLRQKQNQ